MSWYQALVNKVLKLDNKLETYGHSQKNALTMSIYSHKNTKTGKQAVPASHTHRNVDPKESYVA